MVIMGGLPGAGKSWIADALAAHVASGMDFLGLPIKQGEVLLVDEDTPEDELRNRFQRLAEGIKVSPDDLPLTMRWSPKFGQVVKSGFCSVK